MIARVRTAQIVPGGMAQVVDIVRDSEVQFLRQTPGFRGALLLTTLVGAAAERAEIVSLWEDEQALHAFDARGDRQPQMDRVMPLLAAPLESRVFEVAQAVGIRGGTVARFIAAELRPGQIDTAISLFENVVMHAATAQQGFRRGLLLVDRATNRGISIGLWQAEADLRASEQTGYLAQQIVNFRQILAAPIAPETLVVAVEE